MASHLLSRGHRTLLVGWRYLPLWARRLAIRVLYPRFPVGAVAIIRDARGRILLVRQVYHRREAWGAPGGWLTSGESPRQAAAREAFEEIGVRVTVGRILAVGSGPYREISLAFECHVAEDWATRLSEEIDRVAYFSPDNLPPLPVATRRLIEEALAALESHQDPELERADVLPGSSDGATAPADSASTSARSSSGFGPELGG